MKSIVYVITTTATLCFSTITLADKTVDGPITLSDAEMDHVVAGADQPPGWDQDGFPGATNGNHPFGAGNPPGWGPAGWPGAPGPGPTGN
jgi:hypothetical protein